jgi:hypothetical protein
MFKADVREIFIEGLLKADGSLNRSQLEKLSDDELFDKVSGKASPLSFLFDGSPNMSSLKIQSFADKSSLQIRSSAPYSSGSSDQAMLSSPRPRRF